MSEDDFYLREEMEKQLKSCGAKVDSFKHFNTIRFTYRNKEAIIVYKGGDKPFYWLEQQRIHSNHPFQYKFKYPKNIKTGLKEMTMNDRSSSCYCCTLS